MNKTISAILVIILIALGAWLIFRDRGSVSYNNDQNTGQNGEVLGDRAMPIEDYIRININDLAREAGINPASGSTFEIINIEAENGTGTAYFDDGGAAYNATFSYTVDENGAITMTNFTAVPAQGEK